jgi:hypothetical protein
VWLAKYGNEEEKKGMDANWSSISMHNKKKVTLVCWCRSNQSMKTKAQVDVHNGLGMISTEEKSSKWNASFDDNEKKKDTS